MINWKLRYAALLALEPSLSDPARRVLEVGSGAQGIARYLKRSIVGVDRVFDGPLNPCLEPILGSVLALPFSSVAFEDVVCVDTLEHVERRQRPRAVSELLRVASSRVLISGPVGAFAEWGDAAYAEHIARRRRPIPGWLQEHLEHGIPSLAEILETVMECGHPFTIHVNEGVIQHYSGLIADNFPFMTRFLELHERKFSFDAPLQRASGDVPYSYLVTIDASSSRREMPSVRAPEVTRGAEAGWARRAEIFAVGHRLDQMPGIPGIRRILAGAGGVARSATHADILCDDRGDSIAHRNPDFSEMTAIYWVWKNVTDLDSVGFCHYRRYFDFRMAAVGSRRETRLQGVRDVAEHRAAFVDRSVIAQTLAHGTIIVTRTTQEGVSNAEQYMTAHVPEHYMAMVNCVLARYPHFARQVVAHVSDNGFYGNNMFVMPWADFDALCRYWFDCLFALDVEIAHRPDGYQRRVLAFLSERLLDIYIRWLCDAGRRVVEYPLFFLETAALSGDA